MFFLPDFTFSDQVQWTRINKQFQSSQGSKCFICLPESNSGEYCCIISCAMPAVFPRNKYFISGLWSKPSEMSCFVLLLAQQILSAGLNSINLPLQRYISLWGVIEIGCQAVTLSNWCSDLHSANCPRGTVCVSYLPPLAGSEPAVESPELWQVDGQQWP